VVLRVESPGGGAAQQDRRSVRRVRLRAFESGTLRQVEALEKEAVLRIAKDKEEGNVFSLNEALEHTAGVGDLRARTERFDQAFVNGAIADVKRIRLADDEVRVAPAEHGSVSGIQAPGHSREGQDRRHTNSDADHRQDRPRSSAEEVS